MKKTIIFLGGAFHQLSPIKYAKQQNIRVVLCDADNNCYSKKYADTFYNISIDDKKKILRVAKKENANGILAYATEVGATTQAWVAQKLNLPGNPVKSIEILSYKNRFRRFLKINKIFYPTNKTFQNSYDFKKFIQKNLNKKFIIKPVDSSGSKGIQIIDNQLNLLKKFKKALTYSSQKKVICEEFADKVGAQIAGDGFIFKKKLVFFHWADQYFNDYPNKIIPIAESWPSSLNNTQKKLIEKTINKIASKLKIDFGCFNFDMQFVEKNKLMIIEIGPRNGGDFIPEAIKLSTGVDMIKLSVDTCLGKKVSKKFLIKKFIKPIATYRINSKKNGKFRNILISKKIISNIVQKNIYLKKGNKVKKFFLGKNSIGNLILQFKSKLEMINKMNNINDYFKINFVD